MFHMGRTTAAAEAEQCRKRRMRRLQNRRRRRSEEEEEEEVVVEFATPNAGVMSVAGRMREMEDAVMVIMGLCNPPIAAFSPVHFFAVYDGHGGSHVSALCKERLHVYLQEELMRVGVTAPGARGIGGSSRNSSWQGNGGGVGPFGMEQGWKTALKRTFARIDEVALITCKCGANGRMPCGCHPLAMSLAGSTAVVAVVTTHHIIVANCGDSRAVLCRGRRVLPLTVDQKPDRPDELARIDAAGGRVMYLNGARVQGILAMSRAIGDKFLKSSVISEPEITIIGRDPADECLILASDGIWDVISSELACKIAYQCLQEGTRSPPSADIPVMKQDGGVTSSIRTPPTSVAAALLTRLALGRESSDNISVIVVDLKNR